MRRPLAALAFLLGCAAAPFPIAHVTPLPTTPDMRRWWGEMSQCSGLHGDIRRVRFGIYTDTSFTWDGDALEGLWLGTKDQDWVIVRSYSAWIFRHEMLHALSRAGGHDPKLGEQCAELTRWP